MKKVLYVSLVLVVSLGCGGYKAKKNPMSPEEIKIADLALQLESQAEELKGGAGEPFQEMLGEFSERAARFHNACLRFGSNSLEARSAFDRLYYQASQVSANLNRDANPELFAKWDKTRTGTLLQIAEMLGYRPEKSNE